MTDDILTTTQAAKLLGVSIRTAQLWIEAGRVPSWKTPGGHRRVRRADIVALTTPARQIVGGRTSPPPQPTPRTARTAQTKSTGIRYRFPTPANEVERARAVDRTELLDTPSEPAFDSLTWLAGEFLNMPIALVTLVARERQWFKSHRGLEETETPREWAICNYTLVQSQSLIVDDLSRDKRFAPCPIVAGYPHLRFYAGSRLLDAAGFALGTFCVMDIKPRKLDNRQRHALSSLAALAADEIWLRQATRERD